MNKMYGNDNNQVGKLASYFGMEFADLINNQFYNDTIIQLKTCKSEQSVINLQNTVIANATSQDLLDFYYTRLEAKFNETINKFAYKERGYDGIICDTLDDREQLKRISSFAHLSKDATIIMIRQNLSDIAEIEATLAGSYTEYIAGKKADLHHLLKKRLERNEKLSRKSKWVAAFIAVWVGGFGIHRYYMGQAKIAKWYLIFSITFIPMFIGWFDFLIILFQSQTKFLSKIMDVTE